MASALLGFDVEINADQAEREIIRAVREAISVRVSRKIPSVRAAVSSLIGQAIRISPEYTSIQSGELQKHFGLGTNLSISSNAITIKDVVDTRSVLEDIVTQIESGVDIEFTQVGGEIGVVSIHLLTDIESLLSITGSSYVSPSSGEQIAWLQWLLFSGTEDVVTDYHILLDGKIRRASRTGSAIMVPRGAWHVPAEFSGTREDNFITRAIESVKDDIYVLVKGMIQ
jgi:hypothetical protein